jgi:hypothetical protein
MLVENLAFYERVTAQALAPGGEGEGGEDE